jgi:pilus assembly protein CpaF
MSAGTDIYTATIRRLLEPIGAFLEDESVSEVLINGPSEIYVERRGRLERSDASFASADDLEAAARAIAQYVSKRLTPEEVSMEARLPDGSRVHIVQTPAARNGLCISVRKFARSRLRIEGLVASGSLTAEAAEFLAIAVALKKNVIVSGGTGSGKTTLLNCLSGAIGSDERIIVIEDSSELQFQQPHVVGFEAKAPGRNGRGGASIRDLFHASLRMRPDRIVVGECRGGEALDMIQAMTSGHAGSLSTCHANTPMDALRRLETMALMSGVEIPLHALRSQVASAIDLIVQIERRADGVRRITQITEVAQEGEGSAIDYRCHDLFVLAPSPDGTGESLAHTGHRPSFAAEPGRYGMADRISVSRACWLAGN